MKPLPRAARLVLTVMVLAAFLPPAGWAMCIGSAGHIAMEPAPPAGVPCCAMPGGAGGDSCLPDEDSSCEDVVLGTGAALLARPDGAIQPPEAVQWCAAAPLAALSPPLSGATPWLGDARLSTQSPRSRTTVLRC